MLMRNHEVDSRMAAFLNIVNRHLSQGIHPIVGILVKHLAIRNQE